MQNIKIIIIRLISFILRNLFYLIHIIKFLPRYFDEISYKIVYENIKSCENVAIFFVYSNCLNKSHINLLNALKENKFKVVFINNYFSNKINIKDLKKITDVIIYRENYGRCFGAYKTGIGYLRKNNYFNAKRLLIMNDTFIISQDTNLFNILKKNKEHFFSPFASCIKGNLFHYQSFLMQFNQKFFLSNEFNDFWDNYKPVNSRIHTIIKGEILLNNYYDKFLRAHHNLKSKFQSKYYLNNLVNFLNSIKKMKKSSLIPEIEINTLFSQQALNLCNYISSHNFPILIYLYTGVIKKSLLNDGAINFSDVYKVDPDLREFLLEPKLKTLKYKLAKLAWLI